MFKSQALRQTLIIPFKRESLYPLLQVIGASLFIALCAQIRIPLFFTPVPLTLQTMAVLLVGGGFGIKKGGATVLLYLALGCLGFPVFNGGASGVHMLVGPTAGYLVGFVFQAYLIGWYFEQNRRFSSSQAFAMMLLACLVQMGLGVLWLGHLVGWGNVLMMGFIPFIPGEIFKCVIVSRIFASRA